MNILKRGVSNAAIILTLLLVAGCGSDTSVVTSGFGSSGVTSDGGSGSAKFAGTYTGTLMLEAKGSEVDESDTEEVTMVVRTDGTATITIEGQEIEGFMNGNAFGFSVRVVENDGLVRCNADAILTGTISGGRGTGTITGDGECKVITAKTGFTVTGTLNVSLN